ncbi:hypothetical protein [[Kitasatospora] papulosa]|uniref:hypothetical protein n=1 Tax=[Kitasatospora] papulosa TaxID=1464011 RepID=UPI0036372799
MNDLPREATAADIASLLTRIDEAAQRVGYKSRDEVLDIVDISLSTGIRMDRLRELLSGAEPEQPPREKTDREEYYRQLVSQRLDDLRKRGADPKAPSGDTLRDIGSEVGLSYALIGHLVNGKRSARVDYSSPLEELYGVSHGYLSKPEGLALVERLAAIKDGLIAGALHRGLRVLGGRRAALRHVGPEVPSLETLLNALDDLMESHAASDRATSKD